MELDRKHGNNKWQEAIDKEFAQVDEYDTFIDKGFNWKPGEDYTKIRVHLVFDVKHDGRHKARLVAGGHLTPVPLESVYSSVVSLRGIRMLAFIAENNGMDLWATDIGNAYLESFTKEKVERWSTKAVITSGNQSHEEHRKRACTPTVDAHARSIGNGSEFSWEQQQKHEQRS